ncbi:MAG: hypothetical protein IT580_12170 [Verrucomicrobiales bacterium]|nr:hypothetical protein [Verrucomicrobiales bacterium]
MSFPVPLLNRLLGVLLAAAALGCPAGAGEFSLNFERPTLDRWVYPFNFQPGVRVVAPTYGSFDPRFDTRDAQFLLGWDTAPDVATNAGPASYLLRSVAVTITSVAPIPPTRAFVYDPTHDAYFTYVTNLAQSVPDSDPGRPVELFGAAYRGGFDAASFREDSAFGPLGPIASGNVSIATRNVFAAVHDTNGTLIDIANHVGQFNTNWTAEPFEVRPWAIGTTSQVEPGGEVPDGASFRFELDLSDPRVRGYLQDALHTGRLRFVVSSLSPAGQSTPGGVGAGGGGAYPWWATKENLLYTAPRLELSGTLVGPEDTDADGLPDDWERFWFGNLEPVVDGDPDLDGAANRAEWLAGTDPKGPQSVLRILSVARDLEGRLVIRFAVAAGRTYTLEGAEDLVAWMPLSGNLTYPEPGVGEWRATSPDLGSRVVRVRAELR